MVLRPRRRGPDLLAVAGWLALAGAVFVCLGLSAVAGVAGVQVLFRDPATGLGTVPGPSVADASAREGAQIAALGAVALAAALVTLLLHLRRP